MLTLPSGKRCIDASAAPCRGTCDVVSPVGMVNRSIDGGDFGDVASGRGQAGVSGGAGLNNVGLLIKITGKVTEKDDTETIRRVIIIRSTDDVVALQQSCVER